MDETVYQCPECNFNADNLTELDGHILEFHSNETLKNSDRNEVNEDECDGDVVNHSNVITDQEDDDDILIENELPTDSARFNQSNYSNDDNNEIFNDDYYYENQNDYSNNNNNGFDNKKIDNLIIQNRLPITTNNNNNSNSIANKPHNLRQKQPIDYNGLNEASSADNNFTLPIVPKLALNATPINDSSSSSSSSSNNINRRSATSSIQPTPISAVNPNVPIINSDNHYERQYTCKRCGFFTNNPRAVLYHRKEYHFEKINIHECTYCQYASQYSGKVERHTLLRHKIDINNSPSKKSMNQKTKASSSSLTSDHNNKNNKTLEIKSNNLNSADLVINRSLISSQEKQTDSDSTTTTAINETVLPFSNNNNNNNNNLPKYQCNKCPCKYKRSNDLFKHLKLKHGVLAQHINDYLTPVSAFASSSETATAPTTSSSVNPTQSNNDLTIDEQTDDLVIEDNQYADESEIKEDLFNEQVVLDENNSKQEIKKNSYECPYCTYHSNGNDAEYLLHVKDHLCGKSFRCVLCNSVYKYRGDCVVHLKRKHQKADLYAQNYVERFNLDTLDIGQVCILLKPKQQEETENEEKLFSCSYCDYKANYKGDVFKHQTRRHPGSPKNVTSLVPNLNQNGSENSGMILNNNKQIRNNLFVSTALFNGDNHNNIKNNIITSKNTMLNNNSNNNINNNVIHNNENNNDNEIIEIDSNYSNNDYYYNNSQVNETNYSNKHDNINNDQYYEEDQVNEFNNNNDNVDDDDENLFNENQDYDTNNDLEIINDYEGQDYNNYDEEMIDNHSNKNNNNNNRNLIDSEDLNINASSSSFNRFQCKFCSFVGKNHAKLQLHLATHYNLKPFVCPICNRRANFKWDIQKHLRKIHNDYMSEVICLSETEARQSISSYIEGKQPIIFENNPNSLVLNHRPTSSLSSQSNNSISNNKLTINQFEELDDNDEQNYDSYQQQSQQQHHTSLNASSLANLRLLARKRTQHALRERKFKCSLCNRTSKWQWDIRKHLRTVHRGQLGGDVIVLREIEIPKKFNHHESSTSPIKSIQNQNNYSSHNKFQISNGVNHVIQQQRAASNHILNGETNALSSSQANALQRSKFLISQKQSQYNSNQQKPNQIPVIASPVIPTCSDPTGNKKFKCTVCPYRSNWKADLFRHLKKRHFVNQPQLENVIILDSEYAASSLEEYEQVHGINVRKRSRTDLDLINCAAMINENMIGNDFNNKKSKLISDNSMINGDGEEQLDQQNELQQQENNIEFLNRNNRLPVSIAELNIKPYKCLKCGFRSDRKSDTLRHIRVKHMQTVNAIKFLRIMSIKEASDTIESYENMRLYKKVKSFNFDNTPNIYSDASTVNPMKNDEKTDHEVMNNIATASVNYNKNHVAKNENEITIKIHATNNKSAEFTHANKCCDFYRCPFCSFKNINKHIMRRHLCIHFSNQKIKINPLFKCNICCFKSKWKFSVKKHILMNHSTQNAYVLKVINNKINKNLKKINNNNDILNENGQIKTKQSDNCAQAVNYNDNLNNEFDEEDLCEVEDEGEEEEEEDDVEDENETEDSNGYSFQNCENLKIENDSCLLNDEDDTKKTDESILLTGYDGVQFQASFLVSNPMYKKKCYFCQACPYKTSNYSNLRQHLLQHRYREGYSKCRYCVYYVSKVRLLKQHEILHPEFELRLTAKQNKQNQLKL